MKYQRSQTLNQCSLTRKTRPLTWNPSFLLLRFPFHEGDVWCVLSLWLSMSSIISSNGSNIRREEGCERAWRETSTIIIIITIIWWSGITWWCYWITSICITWRWWCIATHMAASRNINIFPMNTNRIPSMMMICQYHWRIRYQQCSSNQNTRKILHHSRSLLGFIHQSFPSIVMLPSLLATSRKSSRHIECFLPHGTLPMPVHASHAGITLDSDIRMIMIMITIMIW